MVVSALDDFVILGISIDSTQADAEKFIETNDMTWRHVWSPGGWQSEMIKRYRVRGIPRMVLVGRDGVILEHNLSSRNLADKVAEALAQP